MLTGADVRGWRYSGWSKWPPCAVNIFKIRMGSLLACLEGSVRAETNAASDVVWRGSPLRTGDWLRKSASDPPGRSLIWIGTHRSRAASKERTPATVKPTLPGSISRRYIERGINNGGGRGCNPEGKARVRTKLFLKRENRHPLVIPEYSSNPVQKREREGNSTRSLDCSLRRGTSGMKSEREEGKKNPSCGALLCACPSASALLLSVCYCSSSLHRLPET